MVGVYLVVFLFLKMGVWGFGSGLGGGRKGLTIEAVPIVL